MQDYSPPPHVSYALAHLRHGVTACAVIVLICAVLQMLVFGFVHFTNVRWGSEDAEPPAPAVAVVTQSPGTATWREVTVPSRANQEQPNPAAVTFPPMPTAWNAGLNVMSDIAVTAGVAAVFILAIMTLLGVVVAGGASVPGVERAVSAAPWALLLAAASVPWREFFVSVPFSGVFGNYSAMAALSDAVDGGVGSALLLYTNYVFIPISALACAMLVLARFRAGVEMGVIVTSVSELEERLEREMGDIRHRGVGSQGTSRAVGALNRAIGEKPALTLAPAEVPLAATGTSDPAPAQSGGSGRNWLSQRRVGQPNPGDPLQRPI